MWRPFGFLAIIFLTAILSGCNGSSSTPPGGGTQVKLSGSGSSFVKPIMDKWVTEYSKLDKDVSINYQSTGSGAGINQMTDSSVDFGCSDAVMKKEQLDAAKAKGGEVIHIPLVMGAIVPAFNVPGVEQLNLSGDVLADIYLGKITKWNDPKIVSDNNDAKLTNLDILVAKRADSSGSTNIFTEFLSKVSPDFKVKVGSGTTVKWPEDVKGSAENQNSGVAGFVSKNAGAIGYIELYYALQNKITYAAVKNKEGKFVRANLESVTKAAENTLADVSDDLRFSLTNAAVAGFVSYQRGYLGRVLCQAARWQGQGTDRVLDLGDARRPEVLQGSQLRPPPGGIGQEDRREAENGQVRAEPVHSQTSEVLKTSEVFRIGPKRE